MLFHQKKYGLSEAAHATVGGLFNEGETAKECATRELLEETGLAAEELVSLGEELLSFSAATTSSSRSGFSLAKSCYRWLSMERWERRSG
jgi:8-oxo-dGTP pyrophosphatase MutT (NUDIX family)